MCVGAVELAVGALVGLVPVTGGATTTRMLGRDEGVAGVVGMDEGDVVNGGAPKDVALADAGCVGAEVPETTATTAIGEASGRLPGPTVTFAPSATWAFALHSTTPPARDVAIAAATNGAKLFRNGDGALSEVRLAASIAAVLSVTSSDDPEFGEAFADLGATGEEGRSGDGGAGGLGTVDAAAVTGISVISTSGEGTVDAICVVTLPLTSVTLPSDKGDEFRTVSGEPPVSNVG